MTDDEDPLPGYELIMPFVVVASAGGPRDDDGCWVSLTTARAV